MAALLLLMIGSSLIFVRGGPVGGENVAVTERGSPYLEPVEKKSRERPLVYDGESAVVPAAAPTKSDEGGQTQPPAREEVRVETRSTYAEAMTAYQDGRYAEAERLFSEVASAGGEQSASAALHEGHAARNGSGCQRAAPLYDSVAGNFPGGTVADEALWHAASCYRAMGQLSRARAHYNHLLDRPAFAARARSALQEISPAEPAVADVANSAEPDTSGSALALSDRSAVPAKKAESKPSAAETEAAAQDVAPAAPARAPAAVPSSKNTKSGK
jgi:hypothetical protein